MLEHMSHETKRLLIAAAVAAIGLIVLLMITGCMNSILPELFQRERTIAKKIEVQKAAISQAEEKLVELKAAAQADPTPENIAAVQALDAETSEARIQLISTELDLDEIKAEIAEARRLAKETEGTAAQTLTTYGGPWGPLLAGLVPFAGLLIRNVYTGKANREKAAKRDAAIASTIRSVQPLINALNDADRDAIRKRQTKDARDLVDDVQANG